MRSRGIIGATAVLAGLVVNVVVNVVVNAGPSAQQAWAGSRVAPLASSQDAVTHVATKPSLEVLVPAAQFQMGVAPDAVEPIVQRCLNDIPAALLNVPIRIGNATVPRSLVINDLFCDGYKQELLRQSPRPVALASYFIDRFEVTAAAYQRCVVAGGCSSEPLVAGADIYIQDDLPIVNILPDEAAAYCQWRGARLPTEAEWEYAARGSDGRAFPWGAQDRPDRSNGGRAMSALQRLLEESRDWWSGGELFFANDEDGFAFAAPPGSLPFGRGPFGTEDQVGNVAELVADAFVPLDPDKPQAELSWVNPWQVAAPGDLHVVRGGSWATPSWIGRTDVRDFASNSSIGLSRPRRSPTIGFRCARPVRASRSAAPR